MLSGPLPAGLRINRRYSKPTVMKSRYSSPSAISRGPGGASGASPSTRSRTGMVEMKLSAS